MAGILKVDQIKLGNGATASIADLGLGIGIQSINRSINVTRSSFTGTTSGFTTVPDISVAVTPYSTSSKFLIFARVFGEGSTSDSHNWSMAVFRNGTAINTGTGNAIGGGNVMVTAGSDYYSNNQDSTPQVWNGITLDEPNTTSQVTYTIGMTNQGGTDTFYLNGVVNSLTNAASYERGSSELIVVEFVV